MSRITTRDIRLMKGRGEKIAMLTAYDYPMARLLDAAGIPMLLVGDSLGMVVLGHQTTIPVTMDDMVRHTQAVVRGTERALVVADLPFMSYQISAEQALANSGRLVQEGGAQAVKLEGGRRVAAAVRRLVETGIPVMGHIGLTPQSVNQLGGYRVQGRTPPEISALLEDAVELEEAGVFSLVLECVPAPVSRMVTQRSGVPTIGIGAGPFCDGQVQVIHDILGLVPGQPPKHAKLYADVGMVVSAAVEAYAREVREGSFPTPEQSFELDERVLREVEGSGSSAPETSLVR